MLEWSSDQAIKETKSFRARQASFSLFKKERLRRLITNWSRDDHESM